MTRRLKHLWKREATEQNKPLPSYSWWRVLKTAFSLYAARVIQSVHFDDTGTRGLYKVTVAFRARKELQYAYGVGINAVEALTKAFSEVIERVVVLTTTSATSGEQVRDSFAFLDTKVTIPVVHTLEAFSDMSHELPAQCIRRFEGATDDSAGRVYPFTTNGCAAHMNEYEAVANGIREIIERDAFLCQWYSGSRPERIVIATLPPSVSRFVALCTAAQMDVVLLHLKHETRMPVIAAIATKKVSGEMRKVLALGAHESLHEACISALKELFIVRSHLDATVETVPQFDSLTPFDRARLWRGEIGHVMDDFLSGSCVEFAALADSYGTTHTIESYAARIKGGAFVYRYDDTQVPLCGRVVVKVTAPELFPFFLYEPYRRFGQNRLSDFQKTLSGVSPRNVPHPLP